MLPVAASKSTSMKEAVTDPRFRGRRLQPLTIRLNHWMNVLFIVLMAGSGLEIFAAILRWGRRVRNMEGTCGRESHRPRG